MSLTVGFEVSKAHNVSRSRPTLSVCLSLFFSLFSSASPLSLHVEQLLLQQAMPDTMPLS